MVNHGGEGYVWRRWLCFLQNPTSQLAPDGSEHFSETCAPKNGRHCNQIYSQCFPTPTFHAASDGRMEGSLLKIFCNTTSCAIFSLQVRGRKVGTELFCSILYPTDWPVHILINLLAIVVEYWLVHVRCRKMHTVSGAPLYSEMTAAQFLPLPDPRKETRGTSGKERGEQLTMLHTTPGEDTTCTFQSHSK